MVTCTAIATAILQHSCHGDASQSSAEAEDIVGHNVHQHQPPLPLLEVGHGFEGVTGERCERSTEAHHHHEPPARINQHALGGPDYEEAHDEASDDVDEQRAVREDRAQSPQSKPVEEIAQISARNSGNRDSDKVFHDGVSLQITTRFCRSYQPAAVFHCRRLWRTPSPLIDLTTKGAKVDEGNG